jgi:hypothetical protein
MRSGVQVNNEATVQIWGKEGVRSLRWFRVGASGQWCVILTRPSSGQGFNVVAWADAELDMDQDTAHQVVWSAVRTELHGEAHKPDARLTTG